MTHATRTARTTSKASELMLAPFRGESSLPIPRGSCALPAVHYPLPPPLRRGGGQKFRERLAHGFRHGAVVGPEPGQGVGRLDVELHAPADGDPVPRARRLGIAARIALDPRGQRPARLAAR